ncbi:MAG: hypothetical protein E6Z64_06340, partial [Streptococcus parasanguinis]|nr:hypothetical protein [Streptococcus parasanguinis]
LISSAFTALLNCAEVGRRNRILTNYRFLSHSLYFLGAVLLAESAQNPLKNGFGDAWVIGNIYKKS